MSYRVASLLPSATEIVCAVGAAIDLVGISHECDFPESVRHLPALTRARLRPVRTSQEIDREVRSVLQDALAVYEIELAQLEAARPDVIVTQDLCDVCAVSFNDVCAATAAMTSALRRRRSFIILCVSSICTRPGSTTAGLISVASLRPSDERGREPPS